MANQNSVTLKITSCVVIAGSIVKPGELAEVSMSEARDLLDRGKAEPATSADQKAVEAEQTPATKPAPKVTQKGGKVAAPAAD